MKPTNKRYGVVIVDMQQGGVIDTEQSAISAQQELRRNVRQINGAVVFIEYPDLSPKYCETFPSLTALMDPAVDIILPKRSLDGFSGTDHFDSAYQSSGRMTLVSLDYHLRHTLGINELIVAGWSADVCVAETINSGLKRSYIIHTAPDLLVPEGPKARLFYEIKFPGQLRKNLRWHKSSASLVEVLK
ncbi:MAG TPA: isochorismatase family protein [Candidatus Nanoarchaeia archaeon]|nr:isochorismatase family protein [Candidatus Nanoarchaeia archaeon]